MNYGKFKIAGYEIQVLNEEYDKSVTITDHPAEEGFDFTDHIIQQTQSINLEVNIIRSTFAKAQKVVDALEKKMLNGTKVSYKTDKKTYTNLLIESINLTRSSKIANGYSGKIKLKKVRITSKAYVAPKKNSQIKATSKSGRKQTKNKSNSTAKYHTIRKGETFWSIAPKYGTAWQTIQKLNPGVDPRKLKIGQKVRVR